MNSVVMSPQKLRGELVWFNEAEDHGVLQSETGERIEFRGDAFVCERPQGRVGGTLVEFRLDESGSTAREVVLIAEDTAGRARRRRSFK